MTTKYIHLITLPILALLLSFVVYALPVHADHSDDAMEDHAKVEQMEALIELLQQLVALLSQQIADSGHMHMDDKESDELSIRVEEHDGRTHVHVFEPGEDEVAFFLDNLDISEEDEIIEAIADETGLDEDDVSDAVTFKTDEHDHDEHEHEDDDEYEGIHIMGDGSVMLGNGDTLDSATVNDEGMIVLEDGTVLEPEFDLRDGGDMDDHSHDDE